MANDAAMRDYLRFHGPRFDYLVDLLRDRVRPGQRLLDIGWSELTNRLHQELQVSVDAMGFDGDGPIPSGRYYHFNLNNCQYPPRCRLDLPRYDVVIFAEVLEHLHTSPTLVLHYLSSLLKPGGLLIVQTPNAVALPRRVKMFLGRHPYELIRDDVTNPGHFREYTANELCQYADKVGLQIEELTLRSYFDFRFARHGATTMKSRLFGLAKNWIYPTLPSTYRPGLTLVLRQPAVAAEEPTILRMAA